MGKGFYRKLAVNNLIRNSRKFIPYFIAATIMISVYFMVLMLMFSPGLADIPESESMKQLFIIGFIVLNIFITVFMIYINSFLIKQRKKEIGLYGILGLEKRHIGYLMLWESLLINGLATLLGVISGCVFGWFIFMLLLKSIKVSSGTYFALPMEAFVITFVYFFVLFIIISFLNILQVRLANPIDLLKSDHAGEKKTRFLVPITILGLLMLGYAYYISCTVVNPLAALNKFLFAVLLVIGASFMLFTTGSIAMLTLLKKNKKYYYRSENFVSVAGMFHRMKQNASGLATICILSTMVLVTVSTCIALYIGQEDTLVAMYQDDIEIKLYANATEDEQARLGESIYTTLKEHKVQVIEDYSYYSVDGSMVYEDGQFISPETNINYFSDHVPLEVSFRLITLEDFNRISDQNMELSDNEILLLFGDDEYKDVKDITLGGVTNKKTYQIISRISNTVFTSGKNRRAKEEIFLVIKDEEELNQMAQRMNPYFIHNKNINRIINLEGSQEECYEFSKQLREKANQLDNFYKIKSIYLDRAAGYSIYGGLLFMGAFFTILFLCATVLIIYFKQISEGYEDKERFEMLQKVGMEDTEVRRTINKQIRLVFFLPLFGALMHLFMAANMIIKLLEVFSLYNIRLTLLCMIGSCAVFALVYIIVYSLTAKTYCKIVEW